MKVRTFLRRFLDKLTGRNAEGPEPPARIREEAELQLLRSRAWAPEDWSDFAATLAEVSYRDGFIRGFERAREGDEPRRPELGERTEEERRNWSMWTKHPSTVEVERRRGDPGDPLAGVPAEHANAFLEQLAEHRGTYGVAREPGIMEGGADTGHRGPVSAAKEEDDDDGTGAEG